MIVLSRIFAATALLYGIVLAISTFAWKHPLFQRATTENIIPATFIVAITFFVPFVITFTKLGLNTGEGEEPSAETKKRLSTLTNACSMWPITWYGSIGFAAISWVAFFFVGDVINPFFGFSAAVSLLSGLWFVFVYPTAKSLFADAPNRSA